MSIRSASLLPLILFGFSVTTFAAARGPELLSEPDSSEIVDSSVVVVPEKDSLPLELQPSPKASRLKFRKNSFTVSPFHLVGFQVAEAMFERAIDSHFSLAGIGAYGVLPSSREILYYELGGQLRFYPNGQGRHAWHYGVEAFWAYLRLNFDDGDDEYDFLEIHGDAQFVGVGPFMGYKYTSTGGVILEFQAGYQAIVMEGDREWIPFPILNFNVGKAF